MKNINWSQFFNLDLIVLSGAAAILGSALAFYIGIFAGILPFFFVWILYTEYRRKIKTASVDDIIHINTSYAKTTFYMIVMAVSGFIAYFMH